MNLNDLLKNINRYNLSEEKIVELCFDMILSYQYEFDTPQYIGEGYKPHATKQINSQLISGEKFHIDNMTLVDMFPDNDIQRREIIKTFQFN